MDSTSPTKRRALAPLDANAMSSPKTDLKATAAAAASYTTSTSPAAATILPLAKSSPLRDAEGRKRHALAETSDASPAAKKTCRERDEDSRSRSHSPDTSSVFDTSAGDASWATTATEPDNMAEPVAPVITRPRALTREEAREKAQILRLRLGLASYKVRTGQTSVPLADLQMKPLPPRAAPRRNTLMGQQVRLPPPVERPAEASPEKSATAAESPSPRRKSAEELPASQSSTSSSSSSSDSTDRKPAEETS
ncbi:hypothetical protein B0I35DRAFT_473981 [Stachybotrys elegans]|uniref:Cyclin-dependent kinase n=1 Tax=Stachybotrys elegans TaxID=80388 RepID=A0A8K0WX55_9HYPO|nr:hypothetical protein B0I35DRAFT_473981 [Stachybotrys elegans]